MSNEEAFKVYGGSPHEVIGRLIVKMSEESAVAIVGYRTILTVSPAFQIDHEQRHVEFYKTARAHRLHVIPLAFRSSPVHLVEVLILSTKPTLSDRELQQLKVDGILIEG